MKQLSDWFNSCGSQFVTTILLALLASAFTYIYSKKIEKRREINHAFAQLFSSGRGTKDAYLNFIDYDRRFKKNENTFEKAIKIGKPDRYLELRKEAVIVAQQSALRYKIQYENMRNDFVVSAFLVSALLHSRIAKTSFQKYVNSVIEFKAENQATVEDVRVQAATELQPSLEDLELLGYRILWEQNTFVLAVWMSCLVEHVSYFLIKKGCKK